MSKKDYWQGFDDGVSSSLITAFVGVSIYTLWDSSKEDIKATLRTKISNFLKEEN